MRRLALIAALLALALPARAAETTYREFVEGNPKATVTVIEYASLTCPHCAHFYVEDFDKLKTAYIDPGKIKFVFRDLPTAPQDLAIAAALLARCVPNDKGLAFIGTLYKNQETWEQSPDEHLRHYAADVGLSDEDVNACLKNTAILEQMRQTMEDGVKRYKLTGTPSFVVNDVLSEAKNFEDLSKVIDAALAEHPDTLWGRLRAWFTSLRAAKPA